MGFNSKKFIVSKGFLINKFGQIHTTEFLLFSFSMRFYRFVSRKKLILKVLCFLRLIVQLVRTYA